MPPCACGGKVATKNKSAQTRLVLDLAFKTICFKLTPFGSLVLRAFCVYVPSRMIIGLLGIPDGAHQSSAVRDRTSSIGAHPSGSASLLPDPSTYSLAICGAFLYRLDAFRHA